MNTHPECCEWFDAGRLTRDVGEGMYLHSDIPRKYGLGSSGALCAALYDRYAIQPLPAESELPVARSRLAIMESVFHGKSSGFDPLICWTGKPVLLEEDGKLVPYDSNPAWYGMPGISVFLVDSGRPSATRSGVARFLRELGPGSPGQAEGDRLRDASGLALSAWLSGEAIPFLEALAALSTHQYQRLEYLIPESVRPAWEHGLCTGEFILKLCGSGGGGFFLCFTADPDTAADYFERHSLRVVRARLAG